MSNNEKGLNEFLKVTNLIINYFKGNITKIKYNEKMGNSNYYVIVISIMSAVRWYDGESESVWKSDKDLHSGNPIMTFPIRKRINTELCIDEKH